MCILIVVTIVCEHAGERIEHHVAGSQHKAGAKSKELLLCVYKELMILGFVGLVIFVLIELSIGDAWIQHLHFAHFLIFAVALLFILQAVVLFKAEKYTARQYDLLDKVSVPDLRKQFATGNIRSQTIGGIERSYGFVPWKFKRSLMMFSVEPTRFHFIKACFIDSPLGDGGGTAGSPPSRHLPFDFDYSMYLSAVLHQEAALCAHTQVSSWFVLLCFVGANYVRIEASLESSARYECGTSTAADCIVARTWKFALFGWCFLGANAAMFWWQSRAVRRLAELVGPKSPDEATLSKLERGRGDGAHPHPIEALQRESAFKLATSHVSKLEDVATALKTRLHGLFPCGNPRALARFNNASDLLNSFYLALYLTYFSHPLKSSELNERSDSRATLALVLVNVLMLAPSLLVGLWFSPWLLGCRAYLLAHAEPQVLLLSEVLHAMDELEGIKATVCKRMTSFLRQKRRRQTVLRTGTEQDGGATGCQVDPAQFKEECWVRFDDRNGRASHESFGRMLHELRLVLPKWKLELLLRRLDPPGHGSIAFSCFAEVMLPAQQLWSMMPVVVLDPLEVTTLEEQDEKLDTQNSWECQKQQEVYAFRSADAFQFEKAGWGGEGKAQTDKHGCGHWVVVGASLKGEGKAAATMDMYGISDEEFTAAYEPVAEGNSNDDGSEDAAGGDESDIDRCVDGDDGSAVWTAQSFQRFPTFDSRKKTATHRQEEEDPLKATSGRFRKRARVHAASVSYRSKPEVPPAVSSEQSMPLNPGGNKLPPLGSNLFNRDLLAYSAPSDDILVEAQDGKQWLVKRALFTAQYTPVKSRSQQQMQDSVRQSLRRRLSTITISPTSKSRSNLATCSEGMSQSETPFRVVTPL
jgi:hypothetical protein